MGSTLLGQLRTLSSARRLVVREATLRDGEVIARIGEPISELTFVVKGSARAHIGEFQAMPVAASAGELLAGGDALLHSEHATQRLTLTAVGAATIARVAIRDISPAVSKELIAAGALSVSAITAVVNEQRRSAASALDEYLGVHLVQLEARERSSFFEWLAVNLVEEHFAEGELLCAAGEPANAMHFVTSGLVGIYDQATPPKQVTTKASGTIVGEALMLESDERIHTTTVRAKGECSTLRVDARMRDEIDRSYPSVARCIRQQLTQRLVQQWMAFKDIPDGAAIAAELTPIVKYKRYAKGASMADNGRYGEHVFFLVSGECCLVAKPAFYTHYAAGAFFGQLSMIPPGKRTLLSVRLLALSDCQVVVASAEAIDTLARASPGLFHHLKSVPAQLLTRSARCTFLARYLPTYVLEHLHAPSPLRAVHDSSASGVTAASDSALSISMLPLDAVVAMVDVSGFTKLTASLALAHGASGSELLSDALTEYFGHIVDTIDAHGGDISKFAGDALLVLWPFDGSEPQNGASRARAVYAALGCCQQLMASFDNHEVLAGHKMRLHAGVGLGELRAFFVGGISSLFLDVLAGDAIDDLNLAMSATSAGHVFVTQAVAQAAASDRRITLAEASLQSPTTCRELTGLRRIRGSASTALGLDTSSESMDSPGSTAQSAQRWASRLRTMRTLDSASDAGSAGGLSASIAAEEASSAAGNLRREELIAWQAQADEEGAPRMARFVSDVVRRRLDGGMPADWMAEAQTLSVMFIKLPSRLDFMAGESAVLVALQDLVSCVQRVIVFFGGCILRLICDDKGTHFLCAFGLIKQGDDACKAVEAALALQQQLHQLQFPIAVLRAVDCDDAERGARAEAPGLRASELSASIGITTGDVYCGPVGGKRRCEFTCNGPTVNLAARLMVAASKQDGGHVGILVDAPTRSLAEMRVQFRHEPTVLALKGIDGPFEAHTPTFQLAAARRLAVPAADTAQLELAGRLESIACIREWLQRPAGSLREPPPALLIFGEPGLGKTTHLAVCCSLCTREHRATLLLTGHPSFRATPHYAMRELVKQLLQLPQLSAVHSDLLMLASAQRDVRRRSELSGRASSFARGHAAAESPALTAHVGANGASWDVSDMPRSLRSRSLQVGSAEWQRQLQLQPPVLAFTRASPLIELPSHADAVLPFSIFAALESPSPLQRPRRHGWPLTDEDHEGRGGGGRSRRRSWSSNHSSTGGDSGLLAQLPRALPQAAGPKRGWSDRPLLAHARALQSRLLRDRPELHAHLSLLTGLLDIELSERAETAALSPEARQHALQQLVSALLREASEPKGLVVLVDDAHLLDSHSFKLLTALRAGAAGDVRLAYASRPVGSSHMHSAAYHELRRQRNTLSLYLHSLATDAAAALLTAQICERLHVRELPTTMTSAAAASPLPSAPVRDRRAHAAVATAATRPADWSGVVSAAVADIDSLTGGNPLAVVQLADEIAHRWSADQRDAPSDALAIRSSALSPKSAAGAVGGSFGLVGLARNMTAARIDRLALRQRMLLKTLAVLGELFTLDMAAAVCPASAPSASRIDDELEPDLALLVRHGYLVIADSLDGDELRYRFASKAVKQVCHSMLTRSQCRATNSRAAHYFAISYRAEGTFFEVIGRHFADADMHEAAAHYLVLAGEHATRVGALADAKSSLEWAIAQLRATNQVSSLDNQTPARKAGGSVGARLLGGLRDWPKLLGPSGASSPAAPEGAAAEPSFDASRLFVQCSHMLGGVCIGLGLATEGLAHVEEALRASNQPTLQRLAGMAALSLTTLACSTAFELRQLVRSRDDQRALTALRRVGKASGGSDAQMLSLTSDSYRAAALLARSRGEDSAIVVYTMLWSVRIRCQLVREDFGTAICSMAGQVAELAAMMVESSSMPIFLKRSVLESGRNIATRCLEDSEPWKGCAALCALAECELSDGSAAGAKAALSTLEQACECASVGRNAESRLQVLTRIAQHHLRVGRSAECSAACAEAESLARDIGLGVLAPSALDELQLTRLLLELRAWQAARSQRPLDGADASTAGASHFAPSGALTRSASLEALQPQPQDAAAAECTSALPALQALAAASCAEEALELLENCAQIAEAFASSVPPPWLVSWTSAVLDLLFAACVRFNVSGSQQRARSLLSRARHSLMGSSPYAASAFDSVSSLCARLVTVLASRARADGSVVCAVHLYKGLHSELLGGRERALYHLRKCAHLAVSAGLKWEHVRALAEAYVLATARAQPPHRLLKAAADADEAEDIGCASFFSKRDAAARAGEYDPAATPKNARSTTASLVLSAELAEHQVGSTSTPPLSLSANSVISLLSTSDASS